MSVSATSGVTSSGGVTTLGGVTAQNSFSPLNYPSLNLWYDPSDATTITESANLVSQMNDKSGNARHVTATLTARPTTNTTTSPSGKNVLSFNGTTNILQSATFGVALSQPCTFYAVAKPTAVTEGAAIFSGIGLFAGEQLIRTVGGSWQLYANVVLTSTAASTALVIHTVVWNGATTSHYINGSLQATGDAGSFSLDGATIGSRTTGFGGAWWNGYVAEILHYSGVQGAGVRSVFESYLTTKWGV